MLGRSADVLMRFLCRFFLSFGLLYIVGLAEFWIER